MYNGDEEMFRYVKEFFGILVQIKDKYYSKDSVSEGGHSLWVAEDVYQYVYALINSHAVHDESFEVVTMFDCEEWKNNQIKDGLIDEVY